MPTRKQENFWSRIAKAKDLWNDEGYCDSLKKNQEQNQQLNSIQSKILSNFQKKTKNSIIHPSSYVISPAFRQSSSFFKKVKNVVDEACESWTIPTIIIVTFITILCSGYAIAFSFRARDEYMSSYTSSKAVAMLVNDTFSLLNQEMKLNIMTPLIALQNFVIHGGGGFYSTIPAQIKAQSLYNSQKLNVEGICNNPAHVIPFQSMTLPFTTAQQDILLFMELWPSNVSCFRTPFLEYHTEKNFSARKLFNVEFIWPTTLPPSPIKENHFVAPSTNVPTMLRTKSAMASPTLLPTQTPSDISVKEEAINNLNSNEAKINNLDLDSEEENGFVIEQELHIDDGKSFTEEDFFVLDDILSMNMSIVGRNNSNLLSFTSSSTITILGPTTMYIPKTNETILKVFMASASISYIYSGKRSLTKQYQGQKEKEWGRAIVSFDYQRFKNKISMDAIFQQRHLHYVIYNQDNEIIDQSISPQQELDPNLHYNMQFTLFDSWTLNIIYTPSSSTQNQKYYWFTTFMVLTTFAAIVISLMLLIILVKAQEYNTILQYLIPSKIISQYQTQNRIFIERYQESTVFVGQIIGFTALTGQISPVEIITLLNEIYKAFDTLVKKYDLIKVETMGDTYVVIGGGPGHDQTAKDGAERIASFALDVTRFVGTFKMEEGLSVFVRVGLASGHVVAGVVENTLPKYSLFGDVINFASLLQSTSKKMKIQTSDATRNLLLKNEKFKFEMKERKDGGGLLLCDIPIPDFSNRTWWLVNCTPTS